MTARTTFLLVTTSYPRWANGREAAGSFVADLAAELSSSVEVRVVAPGDAAAVEEVSPSWSVYRYSAPTRRLVNLRFWDPRDAREILSTLRSGQTAVRKATADGKVSYILALWALPSGWWARAVSRQLRIPYSVWMLGSDVWALGRLPLVRGLLRRVMRGAWRRYADGLLLANDSQRICDMPVDFLPSTRAVRGNGLSEPATQPPFRFVFIGRWHRNKGVDLLLNALALLGDVDWKHIEEVVIYGGGPMGDIVEEKAKRLRQSGRPLAVRGFIPKAEAEAAILHADWLIIPSRIESIPVVFSDALKLGRPVIATPVGDLPQLVTPGCGILSDSVDAHGLARAMQRALRGGQTSSKAIAARAAAFSLRTIAQRIIRDAEQG